MEIHLQPMGEHSRIATVEIDRRCPQLGLGRARRRDGRGALAALVHARLGLPLRVVERQQVADVGVRRSLWQFGQHMQQIRIRFDTAGAAREHQAIDHGTRLCSGDGVTVQPRLSSGTERPDVSLDDVMPMAARPSIT